MGISLNPFKLIKITKDVDRIEDQIDSMDAKHLLLSKTLWVNVAQFGLDLGGYIPVKWQPWVFLFSNLILRCMTNQPLSISGTVLSKNIQDILNKGSK